MAQPWTRGILARSYIAVVPTKGCYLHDFRPFLNIGVVMTKATRLKHWVCVLALVFIFQNSDVFCAPIVIYTETGLGGGIFRYDYTVSNGLDPISQAGFNLYDVVFTFPSAPSILSIPGGWEFIQDMGFVEVFSINSGPPPEGTDISPGNSLSGFRFLFATRTGDVPFTASFVDPTNPSQPLVFSGTSTSSVVPEPMTLLLLGTGLAGAAAAVYRRKRP